MLISIAKCAFVEEKVFIDLYQYTVGCRIVYIVDIVDIVDISYVNQTYLFSLTFLFKVMICNNIKI